MITIHFASLRFVSVASAVIAMVTAMVAGALVPGSIPGVTATTFDATSAGQVTTFQWDAPIDLTGDFAAIVRVHADKETFCYGNTTAEGTVTDDDPSVLLWTARSFEAGGLSGGVFWNAQTARASALGVADTRPLIGALQDGVWESGFSVGSRFGTPGRGFVLDFTVVAFSVEQRDDALWDRPLSIEVTCDQPVAFSLFAGRNATDITHQTQTEDGAGASIVQGTVAVSAYADATQRQHFLSPLVRYQARFHNVHFNHPSETEGTLTLHHPTGTENWQLPAEIDDPNDEFPDFVPMQFDGGPGGYAVELDLIGVNNWHYLTGFVAGFEPVESLDDAIKPDSLAAGAHF